MRDLNRLLASLSLVLVATAAGAQQLLPAGASDLAAEIPIAAPPLKAAATAAHEAVAVSWALDPAQRLADSPEPFTSRSREYFVDVSAEDLRQGVAIYTSQPGALVRLNPAPSGAGETAAAIAPQALVVTDPTGRSFGGGSGMDLVVGADRLKAAGAPFAEGTSAFRLRAGLGAGAFELRADALGAASDRRFVMHVFDQGSAAELELRTAATDYLHGQTLVVEAALVEEGRRMPARRIEGFVTSPAGRAWPLVFRPAGGGLQRARLVLDAFEEPAPGLWQVHASLRGRSSGHAILRSGRTAFACAVPSARLSGGAEIDSSPQGLSIRLEVAAASASRYEVRGVLYGTAADGTLRPAGIAHSAAWLAAGTGSLTLDFGPEVVADSALAAPFELRDLRLLDQVAMGLLHRQARALTFGD